MGTRQSPGSQPPTTTSESKNGRITSVLVINCILVAAATMASIATSWSARFASVRTSTSRSFHGLRRQTGHVVVKINRGSHCPRSRVWSIRVTGSEQAAATAESPPE